jgi:OFA family oxalate/formate antiporter-like MFS transporter
VPSAVQIVHRSTRDFTLREALGAWQWYALLAMLLLNSIAGFALLSQAASLAAAMTSANVARATAVVSIIAVPNAAGRILWPWLADHIGPRWVFLLLFLLQTLWFLLLPSGPWAHSFVWFTALAGGALLCYGGGFGTKPVFSTDYFGDKRVGQVYSLLLVPVGIAALIGAWLLANSREHTGAYAPALYILTAILLASAVLSCIIRPPHPHPAALAADHGGARERVVATLLGWPFACAAAGASPERSGSHQRGAHQPR